MRISSRKKNILIITFSLLVLIPIFSYSFLPYIYRDWLLEREGVSGTARIIRIFSGPRSKKHAEYEFEVLKKIYKNDSRFYQSENVNKGDSFVVIYAKSNPDWNRIEYDRRITNIKDSAGTNFIIELPSEFGED